MTEKFKSFLDCLKVNIHGQNLRVTPDILQYAYSQQVEGFFLDSLCIEDKTALIRRFSYQIIKNHKIYELLNLLERLGISALILKGLSVARFYNDPKLRRSTDTDIFVKKEDLKKIVSILKKRGYTVYKMQKKEHHMRVSHPQVGVIEFHYRLYDEIFDELWFGNADFIKESFLDFKIDDLKFKTLGITDGFIFIFLHFVKHYILETVNMKWILDILFYANENTSVIDWDRVYSLADSLGYTTLLNTIFGFGIEYLGFQNNFIPNFDYSAEKVQIFISDVEFCSIATNRENLYGFFHLLNVEGNKKQDYKKYITKYNKLDKFHTIFAGISRLQMDYKFLLKYPFLLPFVWIYRLFRAIKNLICRKRKISDFSKKVPEPNEQLSKRLTTMRELDII